MTRHSTFLDHRQAGRADRAGLAAGGQATLERVEQSLLEGWRGARRVGRDHRRRHVSVSEQVASGHAGGSAGHAVRTEGGGALEGRRGSRAVDYRELPVSGEALGREELRDDVLGGAAIGQQLQALEAERRVGHVLGRDGPGTRGEVSAARRHRRAGGADHDAERACARVAGGQRDRHARSAGRTAVASISTSHSGRPRAETTRPVETG